MNYLTKLILAILLILCLLDMPYEYYQVVRYLGLVGFGILAYNASEKGHLMEGVLYAGLAILFQPVFKISLGRVMWNVVDVIIAIGLIVSIYQERRKQASENLEENDKKIIF